MESRIRTTGALVLLAYIAQTIASYWLAPAQIAFSNQRSFQQLAYFYPSMTGIGASPRLMANSHFLAVYCSPMLVATGGCALMLLWLIAGEEPKASTAKHLMGWSIVFAAANLPALPVMAQDLWISAAWGEMITHGLNPYYHDIPAQIAAKWYPDSFLVRMSYGPLWAVISAAVMLVTNNRWVVLVLFKAILAGFWLLALILIRRLTRHSDSRTQCLAMVMAGWLPASVGQSLAEGHNDIVMAALVLLWLANRNAFGLASAILVKYTAAPLALFTLIERRKPIELIGAALFGAAAFLLFFRGGGFLSSDAAMRSWRFMTPRDAFAPLGPWAALAIVPFIALAGIEVWRYVRTRADDDRIRAVLTTLLVILLGALGHIWPWYWILVLLPAAATASWTLSIWIACLALEAPFSVLWILRGYPRDWMAPLPSLLFYAVAFGGLALIWGAKRYSYRKLSMIQTVSAH